MGGLSYKVATHPVYYFQPLRVQLGEAEVLRSTGLSLFFRAHRDRPSIAEEEVCAYSVIRFFLMIPAMAPAGNN